VFVTGKGGVGKSTVAIALGIVGARRGLRTIVVELASQQRVRHALDGSPGAAAAQPFEEIELMPGLFTISVDPQLAMEEYLRVKTGAVGQALGSSRLFQVFAMATPGMRELLSMGKVWELAQIERRTRGASPYDFVVVDAPATGHGVGILRTPRTFAEIARIGPIAQQAGTIAATIADPALTGVIAVSTPEEMPVNETLSIHHSLRQEGLALEAVILNSLYPDRFAAEEVELLRDAAGRTSSPLASAALSGALSESRRAATQREQRTRLQGELDAILVELPFVFCERLGRDELERLAEVLAAGLDAVSPSSTRAGASQ
jgi:anion-transporting  ArsA/GET3 family ATPase